MGLFNSYVPPGVYTRVVEEDQSAFDYTGQRIGVLIGEGTETKKYSDQTMHRGSSNMADELVVEENISDQVDGLTRTFTLPAYGPVVTGDGTGTVTNDPTKIKVYANDVPVPVATLNGNTRQFTVLSILPKETNLVVRYYFKRTDTLVTDEDLSAQVPTYATYTGLAGIVLSLTQPGFKGNSVSLEFTLAASGNGKNHVDSVTGAGTDNISIELRDEHNNVRTPNMLAELLGLEIPTKSCGNLCVKSIAPATANTPFAAGVSATHFSGGAGPDSSRILKLMNVPVVDGSNGGVVTNTPNSVTITVNGAKATVSSLDGASGLVVMAADLPEKSLVKATYYTNGYQDTWDLLPYENIAKVNSVGYAPGREDFVEGTDFVLEGRRIHWGNAALLTDGVVTPGATKLDGKNVVTTLIDEKVYLRPVSGLVDGINTVFNLEDVPTDGSGLGKATNNTALVQLYYGANAAAALLAGPKRILRMTGATREVKVFDPPTAGNKVFATYFRNTLNDHKYSIVCAQPGISGQGTFKVYDEFNRQVPNARFYAAKSAVAAADFATTGIVWPFSQSDMKTTTVSPDEEITLTFQDDGLSRVISLGTQAKADVQGLRFSLTNVGNISGVSIQFKNTGNTADNAAVTVNANAVSVEILNSTGQTRTLSQIFALFADNTVTTPLGGVITCTKLAGTQDSTQAQTSVATSFTGGTDSELVTYANRFVVTSNRTNNDKLADGLGITSGTGYLGQTFMSEETGFTLTIVDPNDALSYGYQTLPSPSYVFKPGDKLVFKVAKSEAFVTGSTPTYAIPGVCTRVVNTYGVSANDSVNLTTYNKSGNEPKVGENYYTTFEVAKVFSLTPKFYTSLADVYAEYGEPNPTNRLSLGAKLYYLNSGGQAFACIQVPKQSGLETAADQDFIDAISALAKPLPGSDRKAALIVPMTSSPAVKQALSRHLQTQAAPTNQGFAFSYTGLSITDSVAECRAQARSLMDDRMIMMPEGAVIGIVVNDVELEYAVGGEFLAAAAAGLDINAANDVATDLTGQKLVGFKRLVNRHDDTILNLMATDGISVLSETSTGLEIRHYVSTDTRTPRRRCPVNTKVTDYTRSLLRQNLAQFKARKNTSSARNDMLIVVNSTAKGEVLDEILETFRDPFVKVDENDSQIVHTGVTIKPQGSVLWIDVAVTVTTRS